MWEIRAIDLGARAAFVATLRFYNRALVMKKSALRVLGLEPGQDMATTHVMSALPPIADISSKARIPTSQKGMI
jgi:hypothetical protein